MTDKLEFDPATHEYRVAGRLLPSVTQILKSAGLIPESGWSSVRAMSRGTLVHTACHYDDEGDLDEATLTESLRGYVEAWRKFKREVKLLEIVAIEERVWHPTYLFAGTLDRRVRINGRLGIIDIKTGQRQPWHSLQLGGYSLTQKELHRRYAVRLASDGNYRLDEYNDPNDTTAFLAALSVHNWKSAKLKQQQEENHDLEEGP